MAKRTKKASTKTGAAEPKAAKAKAPARGGRAGARGRRAATTAFTPGAAEGKHLVIVESPSKAKTINKYLGSDYLVLASVGHIRDLPEKNPKGVKSPVPGVDLEHRFKPTYVVSEGKERVLSDLKRAAKESRSSGHEVWFATDLDREGEAIAWHLAQELGISSGQAKRVVFPAITKNEIERAFSNPHPIDEDRVNAQQARRILDRIVGYQVSPLLWKKVARGLSAGRVQSVAVRLVVDRERDIRAFVPEEYWAISACFTAEVVKASALRDQWEAMMARRDDKGNPPTQRMQSRWLGEQGCFRAELVDVAGEKFEIASGPVAADSPARDLSVRVADVARLAGLEGVTTSTREDPAGRGPARLLRRVEGRVNTGTPYEVVGVETRRTTSRPPPPYITSTLQAAAANKLGFGAQRTMRTAQQLYEGVEIPGDGPVGLITYMRTDSTHLSRDALEMVRGYIQRAIGEKYLPEKPNFFSSSNKSAQEAHEAIRPTSLEYPPQRIARALTPDQLKLYTLIWERFVACQMAPAQWDSTAVTIRGGTDAARPCTFRATGRVLVFDGFYRVAGVPHSADEQTLPAIKDRSPVAPFMMEAAQKFTASPPRYSEASLIKMLEAEGIGRPSTYASIISVIQDRSYVEKIEGRFHATDLGEVVTDKLVEAFPDLLNIGYTREMESQLDKVEEDHIDWVEMLERFYGPFRSALKHAEEQLVHAKAETVPAPEQYKCPQCGSGLVYRFGRSGRFLSCAAYPECKYASPVDRDGVPRPAAEAVDVACPKCGSAMNKRTGRFGPFLGCSRYNDKANPCDGILNLDKKGRVEAPSQPPLLTTLPCPTCQSPMNLRTGVRGPWLGCSKFPKCRGRGKWNELQEPVRLALLAELTTHQKANPIPFIRSMSGMPLTDDNGKPLAGAKPVGATGEDARPLEDDGAGEAMPDEAVGV
ncbi:MAG: topoisomerase DNA-binding C4 zinc finger domain-containing protein [Phycisphaeraceae bacterium]|nr:topoisomerase DNA-binding C4 zinc finger domain-containing protein [Phycisphaeraceae bacterium]